MYLHFFFNPLLLRALHLFLLHSIGIGVLRSLYPFDQHFWRMFYTFTTHVERWPCGMVFLFAYMEHIDTHSCIANAKFLRNDAAWMGAASNSPSYAREELGASIDGNPPKCID
jgi:hypothetical protein